MDKVILLWTANTERFADIVPGLNDTAENLMRSIKEDASEISPSTLFAVASILEGVCIKLFQNIFRYMPCLKYQVLLLSSVRLSTGRLKILSSRAVWKWRRKLMYLLVETISNRVKPSSNPCWLIS